MNIYYIYIIYIHTRTIVPNTKYIYMFIYVCKDILYTIYTQPHGVFGLALIRKY